MTPEQYVKSDQHLPDFLKDFHDQKDFFKAMHALYSQGEHAEDKPNWVQGHIYVIDWFLWYLGQRGYKLQKCRAKNIDWKPFEDWREINERLLEGE